jgi:sporulation protein YlmC with PRC-barrel domain
MDNRKISGNGDFLKPSISLAPDLCCSCMIRPCKQIISLPVETRLGIALGHVIDLEIETETGKMMNIHVKPSGLVNGIIKDQLIISWSNIVEIGMKKVIVEDAVASKQAEVLAKPASTSPLVMASEKEDS